LGEDDVVSDTRATLLWTGKPGGGDRPRVVIVGGGFGGAYVARYLQRLRTKDEFEILLINKQNHFVFQPMLPEVISGTIGVLDVVSSLRCLLPGHAPASFLRILARKQPRECGNDRWPRPADGRNRLITLPAPAQSFV
jgi:hypothetical protein